jgi:hypothetical protein
MTSIVSDSMIFDALAFEQLLDGLTECSDVRRRKMGFQLVAAFPALDENQTVFIGDIGAELIGHAAVLGARRSDQGQGGLLDMSGHSGLGFERCDHVDHGRPCSYGPALEAIFDPSAMRKSGIWLENAMRISDCLSAHLEELGERLPRMFRKRLRFHDSRAEGQSGGLSRALSLGAFLAAAAGEIEEEAFCEWPAVVHELQRIFRPGDLGFGIRPMANDIGWVPGCSRHSFIFPSGWTKNAKVSKRLRLDDYRPFGK